MKLKRYAVLKNKRHAYSNIEQILNFKIEFSDNWTKILLNSMATIKYGNVTSHDIYFICLIRRENCKNQNFFKS